MKSQKVRKAVIPAAGLGTRFLPATKALAKEMLPIVDIPTIQYIIEEAVASGIEEVLVITNSNKHAMENHFDVNYELEERLKASGKDKQVKLIRDIANLANIYYIRQKEPKGLGHAILCAKTFIGEEPFDAYEQTKSSVVGVQTVAKEDVCKYGIVELDRMHSHEGRLVKLSSMVEKPEIDKSPSQMAVLGRYVLTPEIFELLETQESGAGGEVQLTDAIKRLMDRQAVYAYEFGFIKATIDFALDRDELHNQVLEYIKEIAGEE